MKNKIFEIVSLVRLHDCLFNTQDFVGKKVSVRRIAQELSGNRVDGEFKMREDVFPHKKNGEIVFLFGACLKEA